MFTGSPAEGMQIRPEQEVVPLGFLLLFALIPLLEHTNKAPSSQPRQETPNAH